MSEQAPTIGRIVHYKDDGQVFPAIVTAVNPDDKQCVDLMLFTKYACTPRCDVITGDGNGQWSWPPRV